MHARQMTMHSVIWQQGNSDVMHVQACTHVPCCLVGNALQVHIPWKGTTTMSLTSALPCALDAALKVACSSSILWACSSAMLCALASSLRSWLTCRACVHRCLIGYNNPQLMDGFCCGLDPTNAPATPLLNSTTPTSVRRDQASATAFSALVRSASV
jgi:hypothetical protein